MTGYFPVINAARQTVSVLIFLMAVALTGKVILILR
jgi:hypothetical protein